MACMSITDKRKLYTLVQVETEHHGGTIACGEIRRAVWTSRDSNLRKSINDDRRTDKNTALALICVKLLDGTGRDCTSRGPRCH